MNRFKFFKEGIRNLKTVGTVTRSSRYLCDKIINHSKIHQARAIIELGAGDGVLTKHILDRMPADCKLITFEINDFFIDSLEAIDDDRLVVAADSADNIHQYLDQEKIDQVDIIYSAIPFSVLPKELARSIVTKSKSVLVDEGEYLQIHYSLMEKKLYESVFGNVEVFFQPINIPPAFILKCVNEPNGMK